MAVKSEKEVWYGKRRIYVCFFAPSAHEIEESRDRHHRAAWAWLIIAFALMASLVLCLGMFLGKPGDFIENITLCKSEFWRLSAQ